ncbi:hypothetical protein PSKM_gp48 [Pantoea phage vB_PagM_PSKM]|uniref:Uncharacterized protein n=1 Tax=Pantoea phage vB_PagM_PSKM TaxID=2588094 RepID=A0A513ZYM4_9CAUD|nr:hypothetical protein HWC23_gp48 [Pantoea phage vB_PagM_PSKM]QDH45805.1 hypothetical protein PSKM_gp48 [Pantoea phage vB_PagM_PSKM]
MLSIGSERSQPLKRKRIMTTKTELFAELNDKENRVNATAHIAVYKDGNGNTSVIVRQHSAPNIWLSNHKSDATTAAAVAKYTTWLNEWVAAQAETAQVRADLMAEIEADHAEGEAIVADINNDIAAGIAHAEALEEDRQRQIEADRAAGRPVDEEGNDTREWCGNDIEAAHAEALEVNKVLDFAVKVACCHADLDSVTHNAINNAIDHVRHDLLEMNRYNNRFIVKMMASVAKRAKTARAAAKVSHQEMLERCAKATDEQILSEIPF